MPVKLSQQINVKLSPESYINLELGAKSEWRSMGEMGRALIDWALPHYREAGSLKALATRGPRKAYTRRISQELQDELYTALEIILDRAPSAMIKAVGEYLTLRAGKFGDKR